MRATEIQKRESFLCEAYGCKPCTVILRRLLIADINRWKNNLKDKRNLTVIQQKHEGYVPIDNIFKPPVPVPIQEIEMGSLDHGCELFDKKVNENIPTGAILLF